MPRKAGPKTRPRTRDNVAKRSAINLAAVTTGQSNGTSKSGLSNLIKSARDVMRKDPGLNGDVDRIPQLAWILFLKAFDDLERKREVTERGYRPTIDAPYRWRDWAADPLNGRTGDDLLQFVNAKLLPKLRGLKGGGPSDARDVIAAVFRETFNRMLSGYLLRDVINKVNGVDFASSDDIHTMAHVYESMLREMRDAAGDAGEFYTPRAVIRFMVRRVQLKLGDRVLDPAVGTGGFLVEALDLLRPHVRTVEQWRELQGDLTGIEKKPMPYLLGVMNLMLHGIEQPRIRRDNALGHPVTQIPASAKVDVVVTNPPFGGEEEKTVQANFPEGLRTDETALMFLEFIRRSLKPGGRCAMVVPNGVLFGGGVASKIKQKLLEECDVHTIVRLPAGVFAPYTAIPTNLVFFDKTGPTREIWYYEQPLPDGRRTYSKTRPLQYIELTDCEGWWGRSRSDREENEHAWRVPIDAIAIADFNLDQKNPHAPPDASALSSVELLARIKDRTAQVSDLLMELPQVRERLAALQHAYPPTRLADLVTFGGGGTPSRDEARYWSGTLPWVSPKDMKRPLIHDTIEHISEAAVRETTVRLHPAGTVLVVIRGMILTRRVPVAVAGRDLTVNQDMKALIPGSRIRSDYLAYALRAAEASLLARVEQSTHGTRRLATEILEELEIPLPPIEEQATVAKEIEDFVDRARGLLALQHELNQLSKALEVRTADETSWSGWARVAAR